MTTPEKVIANIVANRIHGEPENYAKVVLSALRSAGYVIVPKEPTDSAIETGEDLLDRVRNEGIIRIYATDIYRAMIAAAQETTGEKAAG